ncbi:septum formation family protein [Micromonospora sp. Llam7]|uniref:septum formation family protein n=1 Tax=Micromonospora tarapacensis TaxID=2835305 RepID=UPI001C82F823|nr:septum formation family protein [Micromonospora tarapacensis]MBX7267875.1 septum formation family protein [Micromonospora tarapacensis]
MRRWLTGVALGAVVTTALLGCTRPAGVDGDLVDDWAPVAAPTVFTPASRTCHPQPQDVGYLSAYAPVDCAQPHRAETLHVGTLTDVDGARPPATGNAGMRTAFDECDRQARTALGGDWRGARIGLIVVFPSPRAWTGGARWFRCDVHELRGLDTPIPVRRTSSLTGSLDGSSPLRHGCFNAETEGDDVTEMVAVACTARHRVEFVGVWEAPAASYSAFLKEAGRAHRGCRSRIARFAEVPDDGNLQYRVGTIFYHPSEREWRSGNRGVQCFLWSSDRTLTRSLKGAGTRALPIT